MKETLLGTCCAAVLFSLTLSARGMESADQGLPAPTLPRAQLFEALRKGKIQAIVFDAPFLRYEVRTQDPGPVHRASIEPGPATLRFRRPRR